MGNASTSRTQRQIVTVHPHGCGERPCSSTNIVLIPGSSPRLWGTPNQRTQSEQNTRFIPTAVGNAIITPDDIRDSAVHPHGCGERVSLFGFVPGLDGSSPRLWGTRIRPEAQYLSSRFIPTAVGNAHWMANQPTCSPVHPHGCGERICNERRHCHQGGSSPRLWGTRIWTLKQ